MSRTFLWILIILKSILSINYSTSDEIEEKIRGSPDELKDLYQNLILEVLKKDKTNALILV